jgi:hypothetical protein
MMTSFMLFLSGQRGSGERVRQRSHVVEGEYGACDEPDVRCLLGTLSSTSAHARAILAQNIVLDR